MAGKDDKYYDIEIETGTDFLLSFTVFSEGSTPTDLTDATVTAKLREYPEGTVYTDFVCTHNNVGGQITISMVQEITSQIGYSYGWFDVKITFPDSTVEEVMHGKAFISPNVTRPHNDGTLYSVVAFESFDDFPSTGNLYRIYLDLDRNALYRWNGTEYVNLYYPYQGPRGYGIESITKYSTSGLVDTYKITWEDPSKAPTYYSITNGKDLVASMLGELAFLDVIDYNSHRIANKPEFGDLAWLNEVDYVTQVVNKPHLHKLAFKDSVDYESDDIINKPEGLAVTMDRIRALYPDIPLSILIGIYLANETLYLGTDIGTYNDLNESLSLPTTDTQGVRFEYDGTTESVRIIPGTNWFTKIAFDAKLNDAPSDNNYYARRNGAWVTISGGGSMSSISYDVENEALVISDDD